MKENHSCIPEDSWLVDTLPFDDHHVHIDILTKEFRDDFVQEAVNQGIDIKKAIIFSQKINFLFPNEVEKAKYDSDQDIITNLKNMAYVVWLTLTRSFQPEGEIAENYQGSFDCFINIEKIVKRIDDGKPIGGFEVPEDLSQEVKQMALLQALNSVWIHERQHLIQMCDPDFQEENRKINILLLNIKMGSIKTVLASLVLFTYSRFAPLPSEVKRPLNIIFGATAILSTCIYEISSRIKSFHTKPEKDARKAQSLNKFDGKTPFWLYFE